MRHTRMSIHRVVGPIILSLMIVLSASSTKNGHPMNNPATTQASTGITHDGKDILLFTLDNGRGMKATITNYGGIVTSLTVPDKNGAPADIVLGFHDIGTYLDASYTGACPYFGALIGRYGNRIAKGSFTLDGHTYTLAKNNGPNHLHGGIKGFDKVMWTPTILKSKDGAALQLDYVSPDGEEGYPGTLKVTVVYTLTTKNELKIQYSAVTDKKTIVNLTHHGYFNLAGEGTRDVLDHLVTLEADAYTPVTPDLIPTGEIRKVEGTAFDFRTPHTIGSRIKDVRGGYDHNWVLRGTMNTLRHVAHVEEPSSGRIMDVATTEPGIQFYTGNFLNGALTGMSGKAYQQHYGFCLETQHYPDSPNEPTFPSTVLEPGKKYSTTTIYTFSVAK